MSRLLDVEELSLHYGGVHAVRDASLHVDAGELVTLVGTNGAGKTSLLRAISGLHQSTGRVSFGGTRIDRMPAEARVRAGLCHVPEGRRVFGRMTVLENLQTATWGSGYKWRQEMARIYDLFPVLGTRSSQVAATLSGGEQQMLALARALVRHPTLLVLDEPSMGLAPRVVTDVFDLVAQIHQEGTSVLLIEQNARRALALADRAYVMVTGTVSRGGPATELLDDDELAAAYLGRGRQEGAQ